MLYARKPLGVGYVRLQCGGIGLEAQIMRVRERRGQKEEQGMLGGMMVGTVALHCDCRE
jgi:hypothetical protein